MQQNYSAGGLVNRLRDWFPDREFFMRSQGQVRFIKISSRVQMVAAAIALALALGWAISMGVMAWKQYSEQANRALLLEREAQVAKSEERFAAYGDDLNAVAADLNRRQEFIEEMVSALPDDAREGETVSNSESEAAETVEKVSSAFPQAKELVRIEARQIAFVERLTRYADRRSARAEDAIRKLGLDPRAILRNASRGAMGGPLEILATSSNGQVDPRFERLGLSLARMSALERGLEGIPQIRPTNLRQTRISSGFGYRRDPFTRRGAMHRGLDFKGPRGAPIYSAAKGVVSYAGWKPGYGKVVEVRHGNGLMTRYAHMSRHSARVGQTVEAGDVIGAIGSTGRSTGPHLHFEVRINDRAVNPRPLLESAPHVLKEARGTGQTNSAG